MKALHLYSDWKWTGPSEPALNLCIGLKSLGLDIHLACLRSKQNTSDSKQVTPPSPRSDRPPFGRDLASAGIQRTLPDKATQAGIPLLTLPTPPKYLPLLYIKPHIKTLADYLTRNNGFDIIHCHSSLDHYYASKLKKQFPDIKIVRTNHKGYPLETTWANKSLMKNALDGYITLSHKLLESDQKTFKLPPEKTTAIHSGIDISVFTNQTKPANLTNVKEGDISAGIVARVQRHRRFDIIIKAMNRVSKNMPNVKLAIVGRGTYYNELVTGPVKRLGLENNIIQAGYRTGDYLDILNTFDFGLFLVPGSDGSCRAALEIMASGKPLIVATRGILPEIVDHEQNGLVIDDTADNLAQAILKLAGNRQLREQMGQSARRKVEHQFTIDRAVKLTNEFYSVITGKTS